MLQKPEIWRTKKLAFLTLMPIQTFTYFSVLISFTVNFNSNNPETMDSYNLAPDSFEMFYRILNRICKNSSFSH